MSVFDAIKAARLRCDGTVMGECFASSDQAAVEMADLANEVAEDMVAGHDWRDLTSIATIAGDGVTTAFDKPSDYGRMVLSAEIDDAASWFWGYTPISSVNEWMRLSNGGFNSLTPGGWILLGGQFQFAPAPDGDAQYPYISTNYARSESGTAKAAFTADNDTFVLSERLLKLGLIWRWKAQKGLDYAEDMQTYELALSQAQTRDKGARVLRPAARMSGDVRVAYPWTLGP